MKSSLPIDKSKSSSSKEKRFYLITTNPVKRTGDKGRFDPILISQESICESKIKYILSPRKSVNDPTLILDFNEFIFIDVIDPKLTDQTQKYVKANWELGKSIICSNDENLVRNILMLTRTNLSPTFRRCTGFLKE